MSAQKVVVPAPCLLTSHGALFDVDCVILLRSLHTASIDCVFADPPFNLDKNYGSGFSDRFTKAGYLKWCEVWIRECARVLKPGGAFFLYSLPEHAYKLACILNQSLSFRHWIALTMKGTYPRGKKLYPAHYSLLYFTKGTPKTFNRLRVPVSICRHCGKDIKNYGGHRKHLHPDGISLSDFWEDTSPNRHNKSKFRKGINELNPSIPSRAIQISTEPGDIVLDPFGGGGTTYECAQSLERLWLGTEISTVQAVAKRLLTRFPDSTKYRTRLPLRKLFIECQSDWIRRASRAK